MTDAPQPTPVAGARGGVMAFLRRLRLIHIAPLLIAIVLGGWALASPIGAAPDDDFHLTSTWCANGDRAELCLPGPEANERVVPPGVLYAPCFAQDSEVSASCQAYYIDKGPDPSVTTNRGSFEANYPPVYYAFMNLFASQDIIGSALLMRFVNVLLFAGLSTALFLLLPVARRSSLVWGWLITTVPLGLFLIASNNPSSWAIMGVGFSWLALVGYYESTGRRRIALGALTAVTVIMAAGARGDAAMYSVIGMGIAMFLTMRRTRAWLLLSILPAVLAIAAAAFFFGSQQSGVISGGLGNGQVPPGGIDDPLVLTAYNLLSVPNLWAGVFGGWGLGWLDTSMPAIVAVGSLAAFIAVAFSGIGIHSRRKTLAVIGLGVILWLLPTYVLVRGLNIVGQNVQPRYILPLIVIMGGLAVFAVGRKLQLGKLQIVFMVAALAAAQSVALHVNMRRYVTGTDSQGWNLNSGLEWWWEGSILSPMLVWAIGSLAFAALLVVLVREVARRHEALT